MSTTGRKKYTTILDLARDASGDDSLAKELSEQISKRQVVRLLARFRNARSISQEQVAEIMGCKQGRVSKLENGFDEDLTIGDLAAYAQALNSDVEIVLKSKDLSSIDAIKTHAMCIKKCFENLNAMVRGDGAIAKGVADFHIEALVNLVEIVRGSATQLAEVAKAQNPGPAIALAIEEPGESSPARIPSKAQLHPA